MGFFTKRSISLIAGALGLMLFAGAALADLALGSGYQQLKDSIKTTAESLLTTQNYTLRAEGRLVMDGETLITLLAERQLDGENGLEMLVDRHEAAGKLNVESWSYTDYHNNERITWNLHGDRVADLAYNKTINAYFGQPVPAEVVNPFDDPTVQDLEKVFDALVGSLANLVQVGGGSEGKEFNGTLNEAQVPLVVQAIVSYLSKEMSGAYDHGRAYRRSDGLLPFTQEARVEEVHGWARTDAEGRIRELSCDFTLAGSDVQGEIHRLTGELGFTFDMIGTTSVVMPNLEGKNVIVQDGSYQSWNQEQIMADYMSGTYRADIILDQEDRLIKIGERVLLLDVDAEEVRADYSETYLPGYEAYAEFSVGHIEFSIDNQPIVVEYTSATSVFGVVTSRSTGADYQGDGSFTSIDASGLEITGYLNLYSSPGELWLEFNLPRAEGVVLPTLQRVLD